VSRYRRISGKSGGSHEWATLFCGMKSELWASGEWYKKLTFLCFFLMAYVCWTLWCSISRKFIFSLTLTFIFIFTRTRLAKFTRLPYFDLARTGKRAFTTNLLLSRDQATRDIARRQSTLSTGEELFLERAVHVAEMLRADVNPISCHVHIKCLHR
jgi:hypothetical protein